MVDFQNNGENWNESGFSLVEINVMVWNWYSKCRIIQQQAIDGLVMTDKRIFRHTITREIKAYAIWSSYWSTFPLKKKSRNQEITKSRNQKIRKSRSIQFYTHWSIPIFPSHLDPFKTSTTGNRIAKGRTLSTARSTTSSPLLADFYTASIIHFPSIKLEQPLQHRLHDFRVGWIKSQQKRLQTIIPTSASLNSDLMNLRGFRSC